MTSRHIRSRHITSRHIGAALLTIGLLMIASPIAVAFAQDDDTSSLGVFDVTAESTGIGAMEGDPNASPYPNAAGLVPNAVAQIASGPSGRALSSILWPGPLLSNAGSLANVIGTPLPPDLVANANYPVKAQAAANGDGRDEQTLGPMSALVNGADSTARTALSDFSAPGLVSAARIVTKSRSYVDGDSVVALAETELQDVEVGGHLTIQSIRTVAKGTTDGTKAVTEQSLVVSGAALDGQKVTIDQDGIHLADQTTDNPLGPAVDGAKPATDGLGIQAFTTKPYKQESAGGSAVLNSGAAVVDWDVFGSGQHIVIVLGGSSVRMTATPGSSLDSVADDVSELGGDSGAFGGPALGVDSLGTSTGFSPASDLSTSNNVGSTGRTGRTQSAAAPVGGDDTTVLGLAGVSSVSDRVPLGWVLIGIAGMVMFGFGLHTLRDRAVAGALAASTCPLDGRLQ